MVAFSKIVSFLNYLKTTSPEMPSSKVVIGRFLNPHQLPKSSPLFNTALSL